MRCNSVCLRVPYDPQRTPKVQHVGLDCTVPMAWNILVVIAEIGFETCSFVCLWIAYEPRRTQYVALDYAVPTSWVISEQYVFI